MSVSLRKSALVLLFPACAVAIGCGRAYYKESADSEVYGIIENKGESIGGMPSEFTIERKETPFNYDPTCLSPIVISLEDALEIAVKNSRDYQRRKESLYSQGLSLTLARHEFDPIFSGSASGEVQREARRDSIAGALSFGIAKMLETGADLSVAITTNLFRYISGGDPAEIAASTISASIVQPLLKGAGRKVALENLTQEERDMVYAIRDFVRFRKVLSVNTAKSYYNLLQQKDELTNAWNNYQNLKTERERAKLMALAGRLPEFEVDQTEQNELQARDRWIRTRETYENLLDEFKLDLGIPTDVAIELDPREMQNLSDEGIVPPEISSKDAIAVAIENRLDLKNTRGRVEDADRKVEVAANALKPGLDLRSSVEVDTKGETKPFNFDFDNASYVAGIDLELPLERTAERNAYRQALINLAASERNLSEDVDSIKLDIRNASRILDQAEQSYTIQRNSVSLAERRVESTTLLLQAGRATSRDLLDAREDLLDAQNALSRALVDHFNARLDLSLAMEQLRVDDSGLFFAETKKEDEADEDDIES